MRYIDLTTEPLQGRFDRRTADAGSSNWQRRRANATFRCVFILLASAFASFGESALDLGKEILRSSAELETIRAASAHELATSGSMSGTLAESIHSSTQMVLALNASRGMVKGIRFDDEDLRDAANTMMELDRMRSDCFSEMRDIAIKLTSKFDPSFDYGALTAKMPQLRALIEDMNATVTKDVMMIVVLKSIKRGPNARLVFDSTTKRHLLRQISSSFGEHEMAAKNHSAYVGPAIAMQELLNKLPACDETGMQVKTRR